MAEAHSDSDFGDLAGEQAHDLSDFDPSIDDWAAVDPPAAVMSAASSDIDLDLVKQPAASAVISASGTGHALVAHSTAPAGAAVPQRMAPGDMPAQAALGPTAPQLQPQPAAADAAAAATHAVPSDDASTVTAAAPSTSQGAAAASSNPNAAPTATPSSGMQTSAPAQSSTSKAASASGWGSGWGFSALSSKLQQVAIGAVADAKELGDTFTKVGAWAGLLAWAVVVA